MASDYMFKIQPMQPHQGFFPVNSVWEDTCIVHLRACDVQSSQKHAIQILVGGGAGFYFWEINFCRRRKTFAIPSKFALGEKLCAYLCAMGLRPSLLSLFLTTTLWSATVLGEPPSDLILLKLILLSVELLREPLAERILGESGVGAVGERGEFADDPPPTLTCSSIELMMFFTEMLGFRRSVGLRDAVLRLASSLSTLLITLPRIPDTWNERQIQRDLTENLRDSLEKR